jgi:hypothetical protein
MDLIVDIKRIETWLKRHGWEDDPDQWVDTDGWHKWAKTTENARFVAWIPVSTADPMFESQFRRALHNIAKAYGCTTWNILAMVRVEPIEFNPSGNPRAEGQVLVYDQREIFPTGNDTFVELCDSNPAQIEVDAIGADILIALGVYAKLGLPANIETFGRGGGSYTLSAIRQ